MLTTFARKRYRATCKAVMPLARAFVARLEGSTSRRCALDEESRVADVPAYLRLRREADKSITPHSPTMQGILFDQPTILAQIGWMAEQGVVPDGAPRLLLANLEAVLAEHRRCLSEDRQRMQAGLRHLAGLFPLPPAREPEPPVPPRARDFPPLGDLLSQRPKRRPH